MVINKLKNIKIFSLSNISNYLIAFFLSGAIIISNLNNNVQYEFFFPQGIHLVNMFIKWIILFSFFVFIEYLLIRLISLNNVKSIKIGKTSARKFFIISLVILLLTWLPYLVITFPGVLTWDGSDQLNAFFHASMPAQDIHFYGSTYNYANQQFYLTNHHPFLTSLIMGPLFALGNFVFHSLNLGLFLIVIFNYLFMATGFSLLLTKMRNYSQKITYLTIVFFALYPIFPTMVVNINKTAIAVGAFSYFLASLIQYFEVSNRKNACMLFIASCLILLVRNDSFVVILLLISCTWFLKQEKRKCWILILLSSLFVFFGWNKIVLPLSEVLPSESVEMMALPSQQMAHVLKDNPEGISNKQLQELSKFADVKLMKESYNPVFYDPVKHSIYYYPNGFWKKGKSFKENSRIIQSSYINRHKIDYLKLWIAIGIKNPLLYSESLFNDSYSYFTMNHSVVQNDLGFVGGTVTYENTYLFDGYSMKYLEKSKELQNIVNDIYTNNKFSFIFKSGFWGVVLLLLFSVSFTLKKIEALLVSSIGIAILLVSMISPVNGLNRYIFPLYLCVPVIIGLLLHGKRKLN